MVMTRVIDQIEMEYTAKGEAFFHVSSAGHEGISVLAPLLEQDDWLHCHYRDKSLLLARGLDPIDYFRALFNKDTSHSHGRQMNAHMSAPELNVLSISGPVGNSSLHAVGVAATLKQQKSNSIVVNLIGEGTTFEGEFLESLALSVRDSLPVLVVVEDNKFAISTDTIGKTFYQVGDKTISEFMGCEIIHVEGKYPYKSYQVFQQAIQSIRDNSAPKIVVFSVERLSNHSNADNQQLYRSKQDIDQVWENSDPIVNLLVEIENIDTQEAREKFDAMQKEMYAKLKPLAIQAQRENEPKAVFTAIKEFSINPTVDEKYEEGPLVMIDSIREVLWHWLEKDASVFLYGQDIEDPKGDVFGLTKGLSTAFSGRVVNSPLSESLIVGTSIGRALAGQKPVAFLQFADFFPLAFNQIYSDLGSMYWRTGGNWEVPLIIMATCGGYKPGLGPFHAASMESFAAHIPGIDVFIPSNAKDAAGLLNTAFISNRPTVFFYPKNLINVKNKTISKQGARSLIIAPGKASIIKQGEDITFVAFGNTVPLCMQVADTLSEYGKQAEVIDLRTVKPIDFDTVLQSVQKTTKLLVTHEDSLLVSVSSELIASISEKAGRLYEYSRVARPDTYIPCNFSNQLEVLPSYRSILTEAVRMLEGEVSWQEEKNDQNMGIAEIEAIGSSPSDELFVVTQWNKNVGDFIKEGELLVEAEADKSTVDVKSSVSGEIITLLCEEGDSVPIGSVIAKIKTDDIVIKTVTREDKGNPKIIFSSSMDTVVSSNHTDTDVYLSYMNTVLGKKLIDNKEIVQLSPQWTEEKIFNSTGIQQRHWISDDQSLVSMCTEVAKKTLDDAELRLQDIDGIICATGTHEYYTPSLATMVQYELEKQSNEELSRSIFAYDISAACSGFIFALSNVYQYVRNNANKKFLLITGEVLSKRIDLSDYQTAPVFSDAASATIVSTEKIKNSAKLFNPILRTVGVPAEMLMVPEKGYIAMNGLEVYKFAIQYLSDIAQQVCNNYGISFEDIDIIVPHQANQKIINIMAKRLHISLDRFYINIDKHGNSSSNTIPICLKELQSKDNLAGKTVLIVAFGGGLTFGGALLQY